MIKKKEGMSMNHIKGYILSWEARKTGQDYPGMDYENQPKLLSLLFRS